MNIRKIEEKIFKTLGILSTILILSMLLYILYVIVRKGLPSLTWSMISEIPTGGFYLGKEGGILNAILGSLYVITGAIAFSFIISVPVVMYLNFTLKKGSKFANMARLTFDVLFGIPSIVYGAFGFTLMIFFGLKTSLLAGIITIGLLVLPVMIRAIDEVAGTIPKTLIEAPKALGATNYETLKVLFKQLLPGISTATLLAIGRGIGDAATVLFTAGYTDSIPNSLGQPAATLPLAIFFQLGSPVEEVQNRAYAAALILTIIILLLSFAARFLSRTLSKNKV
ncbi:MAG: ABC transporter permease subunit [Breznakibacter sp.]|nr:ABC transporter permease subunit [Breznakibacter sp.]